MRPEIYEQRHRAEVALQAYFKQWIIQKFSSPPTKEIADRRKAKYLVALQDIKKYLESSSLYNYLEKEKQFIWAVELQLASSTSFRRKIPNTCPLTMEDIRNAV